MKIRYFLIPLLLIFIFFLGFSFQNPPLINAAAENNLEKVKRLLKEKEYIDQEDTPGRTALHHAAFHGHTEMCEFLIQKGANVNPQDVNGCTPLFDAAEQGHLEIVRILIQNGAWKDHSCFSQTPLQAATENAHHQVALELKK